MKREFLMLAHPRKDEPLGDWFWSEKLDGCRAFWDGPWQHLKDHWRAELQAEQKAAREQVEKRAAWDARAMAGSSF